MRNGRGMLGILSAIAIGTYAHAAPNVGPTFEYKVIEARSSGVQDAKSAEQLLNKLGAEGWELVEWGAVAIFKRPQVRQRAGASIDDLKPVPHDRSPLR